MADVVDLEWRRYVDAACVESDKLKALADKAMEKFKVQGISSKDYMDITNAWIAAVWWMFSETEEIAREKLHRSAAINAKYGFHAGPLDPDQPPPSWWRPKSSFQQSA